jgi:hypothetical protein
MIASTTDGQLKCNRTRSKCKKIFHIATIIFPCARRAVCDCPTANRNFPNSRAGLQTILTGYAQVYAQQKAGRFRHDRDRAGAFTTSGLIIRAASSSALRSPQQHQPITRFQNKSRSHVMNWLAVTHHCDQRHAAALAKIYFSQASSGERGYGAEKISVVAPIAYQLNSSRFYLATCRSVPCKSDELQSDDVARNVILLQHPREYLGGCFNTSGMT